MSAALIGVISNPADNTALNDSAERNIDPRNIVLGGSPATANTGDLVRLWCQRRSLVDIVMNKTGGQSWTARPTRQTAATTAKLFECYFNGTWDAANLPSITSSLDATVCIQLYVEVWRDAAGQLVNNFTQNFTARPAPTSPFDASAVTTRSTTVANALVIVNFFSTDSNTWGNPSAGFTPVNSQAQYRCLGASSRNMSIATLTRIQATAGAVGTIVNRQLTLGGVGYMWAMDAYQTISAGVTIASVNTGSTPVLQGQTGVVFTGTKTGASWSSVTISPTNNAADAGAVAQTIASQTSGTFTLNALALGALADYTNLFVFATDSSGNTNSTGFVIQRGFSMTLTYRVKNLAGIIQTSVTGISYNVQAVGILGTSVLSGTNASTDGSGNTTLGPYAPASAPALTRGDPVYLTLMKDNATITLAIATSVKLAPTYV